MKGKLLEEALAERVTEIKPKDRKMKNIARCSRQHKQT